MSAPDMDGFTRHWNRALAEFSGPEEYPGQRSKHVVSRGRALSDAIDCLLSIDRRFLPGRVSQALLEKAGPMVMMDKVPAAEASVTLLAFWDRARGALDAAHEIERAELRRRLVEVTAACAELAKALA